MFGKIKLNLFIDCSGSYSDNVQETNKLLNALKEIEKFDHEFEFDLVAIGDGQTLMPKNERVSSAYTGTDFGSKKFNQLFNQIQKSNCININLLLVDGYNNGNNRNPYANFKGKRSCIITDESNADAVKKQTNCKCIIVNDSRKYSTKLIDNVCTLLEGII